MRVLIPTEHHDIHAKVVQRALAERGHDAVLWYACDLPARQTLDLEIASSGAVDLRIRGVDIDARGAFDVVWVRRPVDAVLPDDMHPGDRTFAAREWQRMNRAVWQTIAPRAFWVNPWESAGRANAKPLQLVTAAELGFTVPRTLCSSDPTRIRAFIRDNPGETIYKPFGPGQWRTPEGAAHVFTAVIDEDSLPDDDVLRLSPGIYQPRVAKAHELRVTMIGAHIFAAELASQSIEAAQVDWRIGTRAIETRPTTLPPALEARCRAYMARLGLVFGCIDLIVTPTGEHVFLEINQMGQFLWLEELVPEMRLLDAFCAMLEQGRPDFAWRPEAAALRFAALHDPEREAAIDAQHVAHPWFHLLEDEHEEADEPEAAA